MDSDSNKKERQHTPLIFAIVVSLLSISSYAIWFIFINDQHVSRSANDWGAFGSYLAGTAGVSFALATAWMLAKTLQIQQKELEQTKDELRRSSDALDHQVKLAEDSKKSEREFYIIQTIDKNISDICNQNISHKDNARIVWYYGNSSSTMPPQSEQIKDIVAQYMHLIYHAVYPEKHERTGPILELAQPTIYKYRKLLYKAYNAGYFEKYSIDIVNHAITQLRFENLELVQEEEILQ